TAFAHTGGADSPRTFSEAWALCAHARSTPAAQPVPAPGSLPAPAAVPGLTTVPGSTLVPGLPGSTTAPAPVPGTTPPTTPTLTVIEVPLPLGLGGIAIPVTRVALPNATGTVQSQDGNTTLGE